MLLLLLRGSTPGAPAPALRIDTRYKAGRAAKTQAVTGRKPNP